MEVDSDTESTNETKKSIYFSLESASESEAEPEVEPELSTRNEYSVQNVDRDSTKWKFLEHKGPVFTPPYEPLPPKVRFFYDGEEMKLSQNAEEAAGFYARLLYHKYTTKRTFNDNFFKDWLTVMTPEEAERIKELSKCNFNEMYFHFKTKLSKEEIAAREAEKQKMLDEYGFCVIDGQREKIQNCKVEPPGLFKGRGKHPLMGRIKKRVMPEDVQINCSIDSKIPDPPYGHKWKDVKHDNTVQWLASWTDNVLKTKKYIELDHSSTIRGNNDLKKYETARMLHTYIDQIRDQYTKDWEFHNKLEVRQRAVALYFIDRLALRAGSEKDVDEADTVGCCSLRVEHMQLHREKDGKVNVVVFDFLGKDSIKYYNEVTVEERVYQNLESFTENKKDGDDLFDKLNTKKLNDHLKDLMPDLTAKVFRTYNASITLQRQLDALTDEKASVTDKIDAYNRANLEVAVLCNHQQSISKAFKSDVDTERTAEDEDHDSNVLYKPATASSMIYYNDPRITVAWCLKHNVPIERIYTKSQRKKFHWAIKNGNRSFIFCKVY